MTRGTVDTRAPEFSDKSMPVFYPKVSLWWFLFHVDSSYIYLSGFSKTAPLKSSLHLKSCWQKNKRLHSPCFPLALSSFFFIFRIIITFLRPQTLDSVSFRGEHSWCRFAENTPAVIGRIYTICFYTVCKQIVFPWIIELLQFVVLGTTARKRLRLWCISFDVFWTVLETQGKDFECHHQVT